MASKRESGAGDLRDDPIVCSSSDSEDDGVEITVKRFVDQPYRSPYKITRVTSLKPRRLSFSPIAIAPPIDKKRNRMNRRLAIHREISNMREAFYEFQVRFNKALRAIEDKIEEERIEDRDNDTSSSSDRSESEKEEEEAEVDRFLLTPSSDFEKEYFEE